MLKLTERGRENKTFRCVEIRTAFYKGNKDTKKLLKNFESHLCWKWFTRDSFTRILRRMPEEVADASLLCVG